MMRWLDMLTPASVAALLIAAFGLYAVKEDTRLLQDRKRGVDRQVAQIQATIAELTAEKAVLTRPERIEILVRRHLTLQPVTPQQMTALSVVPWLPEQVPVGASQGVPVP